MDKNGIETENIGSSGQLQVNLLIELTMLSDTANRNSSPQPRRSCKSHPGDDCFFLNVCFRLDSSEK